MITREDLVRNSKDANAFTEGFATVFNTYRNNFLDDDSVGFFTKGATFACNMIEKLENKTKKTTNESK